ncbi:MULTISPECIES: dienelactone hydrolase family protein [unclassified Sphingomonas]|uniref:dienelactone hydrolase family protein n=1 Tax=unclassified Sphingomonas TaxID=196159 RepID=UPI0006FC0F02|nr:MULTISPECIES: dienelactone hydrolase family protein [unclassified Sphingomonas]KQX17461.1 carboxymethylenebutenolidase [Sphingomonas sp. Root1294]KQY70387.1 carboxymethylenebutenolidase [Sphingomonas sp. Root50]KRB92126.1 carboxymethylenebutenolidase [Sphingomonas sp. Root720]
MAQIDSFDGDRFDAYVASPVTEGPAPGIVVIQEIRGVNEDIRGICDRLARQGYLAIAPDMLWRQERNAVFDPDTPAGWDKAMSLHQGFDEDKAVRDIGSAVEWLRAQPGCSGKVGVIGYCLGGKLAFLSAAHGGADAAIAYYGIGIEHVLDAIDADFAPTMLHVAELDRFVPAEAQAALVERARTTPALTVHVYADAHHAFARSEGVHFHAAAAAAAQARTEGFLQHHLRD